MMDTLTTATPAKNQGSIRVLLGCFPRTKKAMSVPPPATLPAACGSGLQSDTAMLSAACGQAMATPCSTATSGATLLTSALMDPQTSCGLWRSAIETDRAKRVQAKEALATPGAPFLDQAVTAWCSANPGAPECACVAFPQIAQGFCAGSENCAGSGGLCSASQFAQSQGDSIEVVQFDPPCAPYPCWLQSCRGDGLTTSAILQAQVSGCPVSLCVQESSGNSTQINSNATPLPPGSFVVGSMVLQCASSSPRPPLMVMSPIDITFPQNAQMIVPTTIANDGDLSTGWRVRDYGLAAGSPQWLQLQPESDSMIEGRSFDFVNLVLDQPTLVGAVGTTYSTTITIEYWDPVSGNWDLTLEVPVSVTVARASQQVVVTNHTTPAVMTGATYAMGGMALTGFLLMVFQVL